MADRTEEIINQQSGGNQQPPTKNVSSGEDHPEHTHGTTAFAGKTYTVASGRGDKIYPTTSPGRFAVTDIHGVPGSQSVSEGHKGPGGDISARTGGAFRIGGTEPISGDPLTKNRPAKVNGQPAGPDRSDQEIHPISIRPGMPAKEVTLGCIGLVGPEHYKQLEKDIQEAWARGDNTAIDVHYDKDNRMVAKIERMSS